VPKLLTHSLDVGAAGGALSRAAGVGLLLFSVGLSSLTMIGGSDEKWT